MKNSHTNSLISQILS